MYDTIIIGAGMSGLAAGIRLAYYEQKVCLLERHTTIGGLNSFYRLDGRNHDVGLHAVTNFTPKGAKKGPLARVLRQLKFAWEDFALTPQRESAVMFPDVTLRFSNDVELLRSEVARSFPKQKDRFDRLLGSIADYDELDLDQTGRSARQALSEIITDPLLVEMLLCPLMYYGSARENDMDLAQFSIMFRSIFMEGFARPHAGVRLILKNLVRKFRQLGGELRLRSGVSRLHVNDGAVQRVVLEDGEELEAKNVLSSAGWLETMRMCDDVSGVEERPPGQLSFVETICVLDTPPAKTGVDQTIVFFNDSDRFDWRRPDRLLDVRSGVLCSPNNYLYEEPLADNTIRLTALANYDRWQALSPDEYRREKLSAHNRMVASATRFVPDFRTHVIAVDTFTPTTVRRFTGHLNGAIYGMPTKQWDGATHLKNLFICGTDQGFVGIIGAMISGVSIANQRLLR